MLRKMGLFHWFRSLLFRATPINGLPDAWTGYGYLSVVGESQYQPALQQIARRGRERTATLVPEVDNPFDTNAVVVKIDNEVIGYLQRSEAKRYRRRLLALTQPFCCPAKLIGGTPGKPSFGVLLDHRELEQMPAPKRTRKTRRIDPTDTPF